tara:strand:+ start:2504 stop:2869 length:366 start_codon:yes stop_codon:yes gene_type:complete
MSRIEDEVCAKIQQRAEVGKNKYGVTMETAPLSRLEWLIHAQEEAMDLAVYLQKLIEMEQDEITVKRMFTEIDEQKYNDSLREKWNKEEKKRGHLKSWRNNIAFKTYSIDGVKHTVRREEE